MQWTKGDWITVNLAKGLELGRRSHRVKPLWQPITRQLISGHSRMFAAATSGRLIWMPNLVAKPNRDFGLNWYNHSSLSCYPVENFKHSNYYQQRNYWRWHIPSTTEIPKCTYLWKSRQIWFFTTRKTVILLGRVHNCLNGVNWVSKTLSRIVRSSAF